MVVTNSHRYKIMVSITFSHRLDKAMLFWYGESLSAKQLFSVPEKIEGLYLLTNGRQAFTFSTKGFFWSGGNIDVCYYILLKF